MKPPKLIAMFAKIATIMLVLGMFASAAYAETPREQYQNATEQYQTLKDKASDAQQTYQDSREGFLAAKERFEAARTNENLFELKQTIKEFLTHTIDYTIKRIEALIERARTTEENGFAPFIISENLENYKDQLEDLKDSINSAESGEDFQAIIREIGDIWQHVQLESRYFIMGTLNNKIDVFLERGESLAERIQAEINRLDEAGEDTKELKKLLEDYQNALDDAAASHELANDLFAEHSGFDDNGVLENAQEARDFLSVASTVMRDTNLALRETNSILRQIFAELKEHRPGSVDLRGAGELTASGNGKASLSGNLRMQIRAGKGILTVTDYGGDTEIHITGKGTKEIIDDRTVKYNGFDGTATINGSSVTVVIDGEDIELNAEGTGSAVLRGYGIYSMNRTRHRHGWAVQTRSEIENHNETTQLQNQTQVSSQFGNPETGESGGEPGGETGGGESGGETGGDESGGETGGGEIGGEPGGHGGEHGQN